MRNDCVIVRIIENYPLGIRVSHSVAWAQWSRASLQEVLANPLCGPLIISSLGEILQLRNSALLPLQQ